MAAPTYVVDKNGNAIPLAGDKKGRLLLAYGTTWTLIVLNIVQAAVLVYIAAQV